MRINIGLISDGRTSHGIYQLVLDEIKKDQQLDYKYIITGSHLDSKHGSTEYIIKNEKYKISKKFNLKIDSDKEKNHLDILTFYIKKISEYLDAVKIDIFLGQGDRIITMAAAIACTYKKIPFAHMHGGEKSGTLDETIRHTITKLSDIHFPATKQSYNRIIKMGELKKNTHLVGSTAVQYIYMQKLLDKASILKKVGIKQIFKKYVVLLYNPDNSRQNLNSKDVKIIIDQLIFYKLKIIIIYPNNDPFSDDIIGYYRSIANLDNIKIIKTLPFGDYLSLLKNSIFLIGNSSGGIIETPSLGIPNILVGYRQKGRELAKNTIHSKLNKKDIHNMISKSLNDSAFLRSCKLMNNPYLNKNQVFPSVKIINILKNKNLKDIKNKQISY